MRHAMRAIKQMCSEEGERETEREIKREGERESRDCRERGASSA